MLLIYTHKITSRFTYTMNQVFSGILGIEIRFTATVEDFIKHQGPKITYTKQPLQSEFHIGCHPLLFENGISDFDIHMQQWEDVACFFKASEKSHVPFDIFAASFYLLSRYEEHLPHVKDKHGRYPYGDSIAVKNKFIRKPIVDIWAKKLLKLLLARFPDLAHQKKQFNYQPIIDVTTSHAFAYRGLVRSISGLLIDLSKFQFRRISERIAVLLGIRRDPYDNYMKITRLHQQYNVKGQFFFQVADYGRYDKNISIHHNQFRRLIKSVSDYSKVSLIASYKALSDFTWLRIEKKRLRELIHRPVKSVRLRYNKIHIPETYKELVEAEFTSDYSMGYTFQIGFRAGTCSTIYFYDISNEQQLPIKIRPFAVHDLALLKYDKEVALENLNTIIEEVKAVDGRLITIFTNANFGKKETVHIQSIYEILIKKLCTENK